MQKRLKKIKTRNFLKSRKESASFKAKKAEKEGIKYKITFKRKEDKQ